MKAKLLTFALALLLICTAVFLPGAQAAADNETKTQEILKRVAYMKKYNEPVSLYKTNPSYITGNYAPGSLKAEVLDNALYHLNYARYIANLPECTLSSDLCDRSQYGTTLMAATSKVSHSLSLSDKPADMPGDFFLRGNEALGSGCIGERYGSMRDFFYACLNDSNSTDISTVGNRASLLSYNMLSVGFGHTGMYDMIYTADTSRPSSLPALGYVTWPSEGVFPLDLIDGIQVRDPVAWSCHMNPADYSNLENATVTLTRQRDGKQWKFGKGGTLSGFYKSYGGYGGYTALIFRPSDVGGYRVGDVFTVSITGLQKYSSGTYSSASINYTVHFISTELLTKLALSAKSSEVGLGAALQVTAQKTPSSSPEKITWKSSDTAVATVSASGLVTGKQIGSVTITATSLMGKTASIKLSVVKAVAAQKYVSLRIGYTKAIQNGAKTTIDTAGTKPSKISGKTMLPLRFVSEKMGAKVTYKDDKTPITMVYGAKTVGVTLGSRTMTVTENGRTMSITIDVAAQKKGGKTFVPLRAIGQALGFHVYYEGSTEIIVVSSPAPSSSVLQSRLSEARAYIK